MSSFGADPDPTREQAKHFQREASTPPVGTRYDKRDYIYRGTVSAAMISTGSATPPPTQYETRH